MKIELLCNERLRDVVYISFRRARKRFLRQIRDIIRLNISFQMQEMIHFIPFSDWKWNILKNLIKYFLQTESLSRNRSISQIVVRFGLSVLCNNRQHFQNLLHAWRLFRLIPNKRLQKNSICLWQQDLPLHPSSPRNLSEAFPLLLLRYCLKYHSI